MGCGTEPRDFFSTFSLGIDQNFAKKFACSLLLLLAMMRSRRGLPRPSRAMAARPERPLAVLHVWCERLGRLTQPRLRAIAQRARLHARRVSAIAHHAICPSDDALSPWAAPAVPCHGGVARAPSGVAAVPGPSLGNVFALFTHSIGIGFPPLAPPEGALATPPRRGTPGAAHGESASSLGQMAW